VLMENAAHRVVEFLAETFAPLASRRIAILCGKGNNGGDGMAIARQLHTRFHPRALGVALAADPAELQGDALENYRMLEACGCPVEREISPEMRDADIVVDALLGTGLNGPATGPVLEWIREVNSGFPRAQVVAVDVPSGMASDSGSSLGETVEADYTVTFTAPKVCHALAPNCERAGQLKVAPIGSPPELYEEDDSILLSLLEPAMFRPLLAPRDRAGHKGDYGHVLVVGGSRGKTGAAAMTGMAALRAGAGLVTVASAESAIATIAAHCAELMTEPLPETPSGAIVLGALKDGPLPRIASDKDVVAIGPGLGVAHESVELVRRVVASFHQPLVIDADGLNALAGAAFSGRDRVRVLTPHPGEMGRLTGVGAAEVQADRVGVARVFAKAREVTLVLKGSRTLIAFRDGRLWINPTGTPAMATGGAGDILTGFIAGFLAQFPEQPDAAVGAAVYLHGLAGELGAAELGEKCLIATDLLRFLPAAIHACV